MLSIEQKSILSNIIQTIEVAKETLKENKEVSLLKNFLIKNFDPSEEKITKIVKILELNEKVEFKIEKETSEYFMLKGFLLKLKDLGFNFPFKKKKEVMFDIDTNINIDYLLNTSKSILKKDLEDEEKDLIKKQALIHGNNYENIGIALGISKERVETILKKIERGENMRTHNPKVRKANEQI
jgi:DNA-directed RNA polymerase sigma subunit (sigma70/sigma32)